MLVLGSLRARRVVVAEAVAVLDGVRVAVDETVGVAVEVAGRIVDVVVALTVAVDVALTVGVGVPDDCVVAPSLAALAIGAG